MFISLNPARTIEPSGNGGKSGQTGQSESANSRNSEKLDEAVEKFEGFFLSMMIKELRSTGMGEGLFPGDASDTYGGLFDMMMGDHLTKAEALNLKPLFQSSAAIEQLSQLAGSPQSRSQIEQGIKEYENEQRRAAVIPDETWD